MPSCFLGLREALFLGGQIPSPAALVPLIAILFTVTVEVKVVVLVKVSVCEADAPKPTSPKFTGVGASDAVVGDGGIRKETTKPSCGVRPAAVLELLALIAAKSVEKCG